MKKVAETATLKAFSVVSIHADITQPPEKVVGDHKFTIQTEAGGKIIDERSAEVLVTLQVAIHRKDSDPHWCLIACTVRLVYRFSAGVPARADLAEFAKLNGMYNAWPYLREIVQSMTLRMGISPLVLPMFRAKSPLLVAAKK